MSVRCLHAAGERLGDRLQRGLGRLQRAAWRLTRVLMTGLCFGNQLLCLRAMTLDPACGGAFHCGKVASLLFICDGDANPII